MRRWEDERRILTRKWEGEWWVLTRRWERERWLQELRSFLEVEVVDPTLDFLPYD